MVVNDGALAEYMASVCKRYIEKYPCEFLLHLDDKVSKIDLEKWTGFIGFDVYDKDSFQKFALEIDRKVKTDCSTRKLDWDKVKVRIEEKLEDK
ncbi:MAG: hypothetical protein ACK514_17540 [Bacteroidota bacterium]|jgi:hypothetical protein|nr:hypothetical protein [Cytophagales bacterium]MCE2956754.1 hypothetical protein [Flammeovirgaceae bacterium]MCZ8070813.1 hypothetical protein [Cytophagales bacterium]